MCAVDAQLNAKLADLELGAGDIDSSGSDLFTGNHSLSSDELLENWAAPEVGV